MSVEPQAVVTVPCLPALTCACSLLENILFGFRTELAGDFRAYEHHCKRVLLLAVKLLSLGELAPLAFENLAIAAAFHDLGIWTAHTFDYLAPSCGLAAAYLQQHGHDEGAQRSKG